MVIADGREHICEEEKRLREDRDRTKYWKKWGSYLSERQWATVREDYSENGDAWSHFPHEHARSRVFRWGEDGIAGVCDTHGLLNVAFSFWNGKDDFLKERLFGLANPQGNHGESVKECFFHLDNVPTHSYMKYLYKLPQKRFPYEELVRVNAKRTKLEPEYQLLDTGIFADNSYFDCFIEVAKESPDELLFRCTAYNRGSETADLHIVPQVWFRNTWAWTRDGADKKPSIQQTSPMTAKTSHPSLGIQYIQFSPSPSTGNEENDVLPTLLFTENETNSQLLYGSKNAQPFVKDAFHQRIVNNSKNAANPRGTGTKSCGWYKFAGADGVPPGECAVVRFRLSRKSTDYLDEELFDDVFDKRQSEADDFYNNINPLPLSDDLRNIQRQAFSGMLWCKQFYHFVWDQWARGDETQIPPPSGRKAVRNSQWKHMHVDDILSMPDSWEYPFFASWDTAFHTLPLAQIDPEFAKKQLDIMTREWYMHPNGQLPAYEWDFGDTNPPVFAWAVFRVFKIERKMYGRADLDFLERVFQKLLLNFTWWVNRKDSDNKGIFDGGFLGLDNIGIFNRSDPLPTGGVLEQADSTGWMAFYCLSMLNISIELAKHRRIYEDMASKFFEHFVLISDAMTYRTQGEEKSLWDEKDGFYYDAISWGGPWSQAMPVRSLVGLIPLFAVLTLEPEILQKLPSFKRRFDWFVQNRKDVAERNMVSLKRRGKDDRILLALVNEERLVKILTKMLDETEFLSEHGIRSLSKYHDKHPFSMDVNGQRYEVNYVPGDSDSGLFGGNSNWRGPVWLAVNFLLIESLLRFYMFYGKSLQVECPTGSGDYMHLGMVAAEIQNRLIRLFERDVSGRRAANFKDDTLDFDPHWRDHMWFHEFFDGDSGRGLGASHQCGWTGLIARIIHDIGLTQRLPQTPKTPRRAVAHYSDSYFDEALSRSPTTPRVRLYRSNSGRSIGNPRSRSDSTNDDALTRSTSHEENEAARAEAHRSLVDDMTHALSKIRTDASITEDEYETQIDGN